MGFLKPKTPQVPTAGENLADSYRAYLEYAPQLREADLQDQLAAVDLLSKVAPEFANLSMQFETDFGPQMRAQAGQAAYETRANDIGNVAALGPLFQSAVAASADPQAEAIRNELGRQIMGELSAGQGLSPELAREVEQGIRRGQSARGITRGTAPVAAEAFARGSRGLQLQQQRQQAADNFLRQTAATRPDAFSFITGRGGVQQANPALAPQAPQSQALSQIYGDTTAINNLQSQLNWNAAQAGQGGGLSGALSGALGGGSLAYGLGATGALGTGAGAALGGLAGLFL